jgi:hypothetical protein
VAKRGAPLQLSKARMTRIFIVVVVLGLLAMGAGIIALGAFPPEPHPQQIQKTLPNDRFKPAG